MNHVEIDDNLLRPSEVPCLMGNSSKANRRLGWKPKVNFKQIYQNPWISFAIKSPCVDQVLAKISKIDPKNNILSFKNDLKNINLKLWDIEDGKRSAEKNNKFDEKFIQLARNVYKFNDERAKIKLAINNALGSNIKEVKSYE